MSSVCKYRLPCGWCDRRNKECTLSVSKITDITEIATPSHNDDIGIAHSISSYSKYCGNCPNTDGCVYPSNLPQVKLKCKITGRYHFYDDKCDCDTITAHNCSEYAGSTLTKLLDE